MFLPKSVAQAWRAHRASGKEVGQPSAFRICFRRRGAAGRSSKDQGHGRETSRCSAHYKYPGGVFVPLANKCRRWSTWFIFSAFTALGWNTSTIMAGWGLVQIGPAKTQGERI